MEMKGINNIRIDDRLIHGQVATMWSNKLGVTRLMVVNDNVAKNDLQAGFKNGSSCWNFFVYHN